MEIQINSLNQLQQAAKTYLAHLEDQKLHCFYAEMGTGKTTFINELCKQLGVTTETSSPTYSIVNEYASNKGQTIYHIDLYRINTIEEAIELGIEDYINNNSFCFIEWPEVIEALLPLPYVKTEISLIENNQRLISANLTGGN